MNRTKLHFLSLLAMLLMGTGFASAYTDYGFYIGETRVTSDNASDVLGNGQFKYNVSTKTLTVTNAYLENDGALGSGINIRDVEGLRIKFSGTSTFKTRMSAFSSSKSFSIEGAGTLNASCSSGYGIYLWGDGIICTVDGPKLNITSATYGLRDYCGTATLRVQATSYVPGQSSYATCLNLQPGTNYEAVKDLRSLVRGSNIEISEPAWGFFNTSLKSITEDQYKTEPYKGKVTIGVAWPLYVSGTKVTAQNASRISGSGISGSVSYDASSKTLTLNGATINANDCNCIQNEGVSDLKIKVVGTNKLDIPNDNGLQLLCLRSSTSITGSGTLNLRTENRNFCARVFNGSTLTIDGPTINGSTAIEAFEFYPGNSEKLVVKGTSTKVILTPGDGYAAVNSLSNFELGSGLYVTQPKGAFYSSSLKSFTVGGAAPLKQTLVFSSTNPDDVKEYNLYIGETKVTSFNASDIMNNGQFSYDNTTKTLTLKNAKLTNTGTLGSGISNRGINSLRVKLEGNSYLNCRNSAFYAEYTTTITGEGSLIGTTSESSACRFGGNNVSLYITNGANVSFSGKKYGLEDYYKTSRLRVEDNTTKVTLTSGSGYATIYGLNKLDMIGGLCINEPFGGYFSEDLHSVTTNGSSAYEGTVVISKEIDYGFMIFTKHVTSANANDVLGDGAFRYDSTTNTLTVKDAYVENYEDVMGTGIDIRDNENLIVKLEGTSTIKARNNVISSKQSFTITGTGTLNGYSSQGGGLNFWSENRMTCTVYGPTLNLAGYNYGLDDYYKTTTLKVEGSTTHITLEPGQNPNVPDNNGYSWWYVTVKQLADLSLADGLSIVPDSVRFSPSMNTFTADGSYSYDGKVEICKVENYGITVAETKVTSANAADILGDGTISYNPDTNTLTMRDAIVEVEDGVLGTGITNYDVENLVIDIQGNNTIKTRSDIIESLKTFYLSGQGTLNGFATGEGVRGGSGIRLAGEYINCWIVGPTLNFTSNTYYGIEDYYGSGGVLMLGTQTSLTLNPALGAPAVHNLGGMAVDTLLHVAEPVGAWFDNHLKSFTTDGETAYIGKVVISPKKATRNGDANDDGVVDETDIAYIIDAVVRGEQVAEADVNNDGVVNIADIINILNLLSSQQRE